MSAPIGDFFICNGSLNWEKLTNLLFSAPWAITVLIIFNDNNDDDDDDDDDHKRVPSPLETSSTIENQLS